MPFSEQLGDLAPAYAPQIAQPSTKSTSLANLVRPKKGERFGGRKRGSRNKRTEANLLAARLKLGLSPLDAILEAAALSRSIMLDLFEKRGTDEFNVEAFLKFNAQTAENAARAAAFCHAKPAPKRPEGDLPEIDIDGLSDKQLELLVLRIGRRMGEDVLDIEAEAAGAQTGSEG
jgi:hypothetical protein